MSSYESFASVYDMFMDNIPYREWCRYLIGLLQEYGVQDGLVLELGCGTGKATRLLSRAGYDMIGIDNSPDMLEIALEKEGKIKEDILYLLQDMRSFELYGTVNTKYKYEEILGECTIAENRDTASFIWDNYYDCEEQINEYDLTLFIPEEEAGKNIYRKYEEIHYQRAYDIEEVKNLLAKAGMEFVAVYDALTHRPPRAVSERVYIIAREKGKTRQ